MCMCVYSGHRILNVFFQLQCLKCRNNNKKQHNTKRWDPPTYLSFCTVKAGLDTFLNWPSSSTQTHEVFKNKYCLLQNTGFHKRLICNPSDAGRRDITTCFHCSGSLQGWSWTDCVWKEHAKHFPKCIYVLHVKGPDFVLENTGSWVQLSVL